VWYLGSIVGVSGTRMGATREQLTVVSELLRLPHVATLVHGDCVGVDVQVATIATRIGLTTIAYPANLNRYRGWHKSNVIHPVGDYLSRNRIIVDSVNSMIVVPLAREFTRRGGTAHAFKYALRTKRPTIVVYPEGDTEWFNNESMIPPVEL